MKKYPSLIFVLVVPYINENSSGSELKPIFEEFIQLFKPDVNKFKRILNRVFLLVSKGNKDDKKIVQGSNISSDEQTFLGHL